VDKLNDRQLYDLYCSLNIIWVIKWRGMICWTCRSYGGGGLHNVLVRRDRDNWEDPVMDLKIILWWIFMKLDGGV